MKQPIEKWTDNVGGARGRVRLFDLPEDLRFADHERVETGSDSEEMPRDVEIRHLIKVRLQRLTVDAVEVGDELDKRLASALDLVAHTIQLSAVAGREHDRFAHGSACRQRAQRAVEASRLKVDPLAQFDRRRTMTDSD